MYTSFKTLPGLSTSSSWIIDEGGCSLGRHPGLALEAEWILVGDRSNFLPFYWSTAFVQSGSWLARITYSTSEVKTSNSPTSGSWYIYSICRTIVSWNKNKTADGKALHWIEPIRIIWAGIRTLEHWFNFPWWSWCSGCQDHWQDYLDHWLTWISGLWQYLVYNNLIITGLNYSRPV